MLSNPIESGPFSDPVLVGGGVALSIDSRYLYVSNVEYLYQYDMEATDILASRILIDTYDGFLDPLWTNFFHMALAPDGKIYMFSTNGKKSLHVINHPTRSGTNCGFEQHTIILPAYIPIGGINLPYFRLGPDDGSVCDTLGINNEPIAHFRYEHDSLDHLKVHLVNLSYFEPETFHWDFGNGTVSDMKDPGHITYSSNGTYEVCLYVSNPYGEDTFCRQIQISDNPTHTDQPEDSRFTVYPNPFSSTIVVASVNPEVRYTFTLYSLLGQELFMAEITDQYHELSIMDLPAGLYIYTITNGKDVLHSGKITRK